MKDVPETSSDATTAATTVIENEKLKGQQQPDLGQLSIGLSSGWQVCFLLHFVDCHLCLLLEILMQFFFFKRANYT